MDQKCENTVEDQARQWRETIETIQWIDAYLPVQLKKRTNNEDASTVGEVLLR